MPNVTFLNKLCKCFKSKTRRVTVECIDLNELNLTAAEPDVSEYNPRQAVSLTNIIETKFGSMKV